MYVCVCLCLSLAKIDKLPAAGCWLWKRAREARGNSTQELLGETHGHINSAGCEGMAETVTDANHSIWRHLYDSMHAAKKREHNLKFVMLDKESDMRTLWGVFWNVQQEGGVGKNTRSWRKATSVKTLTGKAYKQFLKAFPLTASDTGDQTVWGSMWR